MNITKLNSNIDFTREIELILTKIISKLRKIKFRERRINFLIADSDTLLEDQESTTNRNEPNESSSARMGTITVRDYKVVSVAVIVRVAAQAGNPFANFNDNIYLYTDKCWRVCYPDIIQLFLRESMRRMGVPPTTAHDSNFLESSIRQLKSEAIKIPHSSDRTLINLQNGTLEIMSTGQVELNNHRHGDMLTYVLPYEYSPEAECPRFQKYLDRVVPEEDKQLVLPEFIGSVFSNLKHEKILLLYGSGKNGKSVFMEVISAVLGAENVTSHSLEDLTSSSLYHLGSIADKLLNYTGEISRKVNPDTFKKLASGEPVVARYPFGQPFTITNYARLAFNCNTLPKATEISDGFFRRFQIVPFEQTISEAEKDPRLAQSIIQHELPGILNWVIRGLQRLEAQDGFSHCHSSAEILKSYMAESDSVGLFIEEYSGEFEEDVKANYIYGKYREFCRDLSLDPLSIKNFSQMLKKKGFIKIRRNDGVHYSFN